MTVLNKNAAFAIVVKIINLTDICFKFSQGKSIRQSNFFGLTQPMDYLTIIIITTLIIILT